MQPLRSLLGKGVYQDAPEFSDELLLPALAAGHNVTLVSAFAPSYLFRLISDLYQSPAIEPGILKVVFCVPFIDGVDISKARLFSKYLCAFSEDAEEVKLFLQGIRSLSQEGNVQVSALFSTSSRMLTPSCLGVIESGEYSSSDLISLVDLLAEDFNSPISTANSWDSESKEFSDVKIAVRKALVENFPNILRATSSEVLSLIDEIILKGYPRFDARSNSIEPEENGRKRSSSPRKTRKKRVDEEAQKVSEEGEIYEEDEFDEVAILGPLSDEDIDAMLDEISFRDIAYLSETLDEFLEFDLNFGDLADVDFKRRHAAPMSSDLVEMLGHGVAVCWCGEEYERSEGCPGGLY